MDIPKDLIGGARKVVFEWRKKQAEPGVFPFLHAMIAEFVQTEIERVRIERDNLKVSIKSIQDGHTLAVELLAEALGKLEKAEKEENKATFRIFKSLAEALGHDVNLMRDEEIMEIDPYDEIRDLKTELEEVKKREEIKEEVKQMEGDPNIKARIRSIQREMSRRRMMDEVPEADVVITNPVEVAIALKYAPGDMESPKVIAKGRKKVALKIRKIALENDVPIVEDKPLAWALFKAVDVGDFIPDQLFKAVAEILAYVYRLKNNKTA
ncbi:EscU/YscU/HrcU family type III secretion system export apparatus switch protein [candidate division KSB1 bacterium]|nr:EscU/YscU/HrcU family type III secretion system export apparatus switch protein [candidate division KSB1 bacterium]